MVARAQAGDAVFFVAMCDRVAQILLLEGDTDPVGARRSKALGILANPARALALLTRARRRRTRRSRTRRTRRSTSRRTTADPDRVG